MNRIRREVNKATEASRADIRSELSALQDTLDHAKTSNFRDLDEAYATRLQRIDNGMSEFRDKVESESAKEKSNNRKNGGGSTGINESISPIIIGPLSITRSPIVQVFY